MNSGLLVLHRFHEIDRVELAGHFLRELPVMRETLRCERPLYLIRIRKTRY
jgi:hypothetical protein